MNCNEKINFHQLAKRIDPTNTLLRTWPLKGGVSAEVTAMEVRRNNGQLKKFVARRHSKVDITRNPHVAADEYKLLKQLQLEALPVPTPYYIDEQCDCSSTPVIVIEYVEHESTPLYNSDTVFQFATNLALIHQVDLNKVDVSFLPKKSSISVASHIPNEHILAALSSWTRHRENQEVLLHGDFWPGNTLWRNHQLVAVIDWEDAAIGDPLSDLANSRLELLWTFREEGMQEFTNHYKVMMPHLDYGNLPYWDLVAAVGPMSKMSEWGLDEKTERSMKRLLNWFVQQAMNRISVN
ncbi:phosphotransferase family protein [Metabacillus iocasae]|uniref:Aminoglycoside phosphotransferase (APT) family kinase protein n=1 Tax=Priestia iocasae TaxID=2291674 RepID=A0ABS2QW63_9BACI|nr:phosphotransferase [Metabacillus iocasae]MBM7703523.1 aminoglycoside phosphotransferase (APT) family kinase protein [Metabacillus iocasae]